MAFVSSLGRLANRRDGDVKADIVCVPAIGADPRATWVRPHPHQGQRLDSVLLDRCFPSAQPHLYDHLTPDERKVEIKAPRGMNDFEHQKSTEAFARVEEAVAGYGVVEWSNRLLAVVRHYRHGQGTQRRPIVFICHSTGGTVVKQALATKSADITSDLAGICLGVIFFSTPHHGSSVLSGPEYCKTVTDCLGLKFDMSETLRSEFELKNPDLEALNKRFARSVIGTKIYSYVESVDTILTVLSSNDSIGESVTKIGLCITDSRSGKLGSAEIPVEDEEVIQLNATHTGAPRFPEEDGLYDLFITEIKHLVDYYSDDQRAAYQALNQSIMSEVQLDIHQFYRENTVKILSAHPSLQDFLDLGPTRCMLERVRGSDREKPPSPNVDHNPSIHVRRASSPVAPALTVTTVADNEDPSEPRSDSMPTLSTPKIVMPQSIHTRRPSLTPQDDPDSPGHLAPSTNLTKQARSTIAPYSMAAQDSRPQRNLAFKLPSRDTDRFKWIHVPFNHSGWVPNVLTTISQEKAQFDLHSKLLLDRVWGLQHNRSRHASPHARFVRSSARCLLPERAHHDHHHVDGIITPTSAGEDVQFVLYLPYLHWDSFAAMQDRARVIQRRRNQPDARPINREIAQGISIEHRLIWQYLTSDRPFHCRRTLDQYGYPSLRNTSVRDADQILYKRTRPYADDDQVWKAKQKRKRPFDGAAKVLMVDQLWLWIVDDQTVITFFTSKERERNDNGNSREGDIRSKIYQDINGDYANQCSDPFDFAALAVSHAVKALLENTSDRNLQVFRVFEEYISILTERQTASFKDFRQNHGFEKTTKKMEDQRQVDTGKDLDALLELRDIEDELNTIGKLIEEQEKCVNDMIKQYKNLNARHNKGLNGIDFLYDVKSFLEEHMEQLEGMRQSTRAAQAAFKDLLDMKQKQSNIDEAHLARKQTEVAADQSRTVMVFTIFTIVFLPLSFFASIFGMNARELNGDPSQEIPLQHIFTYMMCISLAVIIVALLVAFSRHTRRAAQRLWQRGALPVWQGWSKWQGARKERLQQRRRRFRPDDENGNEDDTDEKRHGASQLTERDLEKARLADSEREMGKLGARSRTFTRMNLEESLWVKQRNGTVY